MYGYGLWNWDDDDEGEEPGRVLSQQKYAARISARKDIFQFDRERELHRLAGVMLTLAIAFGVWLGTANIPVPTNPDYYEKQPSRVRDGTVTMGKTIDRPLEKKPEPVAQKPRRQKVTRKTIKDKLQNGTNRKVVGDPRSHLRKKGVLYWASKQVSGASELVGNIDGIGGFATGIDVVMRGPQGFASPRGSGEGRTLAPGMGFGPGYASDAATGVDALMDDLMQPTETVSLRPPEPPKVKLDLTPPKSGYREIVGGRTKASIHRVVMQNMSALRYAYTRRLREKPGLKGKITVRFAIDEFGAVVSAQVMESSIRDAALEKEVVGKIRRWRFDRIHKIGDITEIVYPFVFSI